MALERWKGRVEAGFDVISADVFASSVQSETILVQVDAGDLLGGPFELRFDVDRIVALSKKILAELDKEPPWTEVMAALRRIEARLSGSEESA